MKKEKYVSPAITSSRKVIVKGFLAASFEGSDIGGSDNSGEDNELVKEFNFSDGGFDENPWAL